HWNGIRTEAKRPVAVSRRNRINLSIAKRNNIEKPVRADFQIRYPVKAGPKNHFVQLRAVVRHEIGETDTTEHEAISRWVWLEAVKIAVVDVTDEEIELILGAQLSRIEKYDSGRPHRLEP